MSKQDRQGVRTPADLERKYTFGDIKNAKKTAANTASQVVWLSEGMEQYEKATDAAIADLKAQNVKQAVTNTELKAKDNELAAKHTALQNTVDDLIASLEGEGSVEVEAVGIASVEQTTTSTADGGINVVTVTKTDGTSSTFQVRNGSKGSQGVQGVQGEPGYTPVKGVDYVDGQDGQPGAAGKDGTSVTVASVSESTADGGSNVVTFSDGKKLTVKNGSKGGTGATGATPQLSIGTVSTLSAGSAATATITGTAENPKLNLGIPKGADGADGESGSAASLPDNLVYMDEDEETVTLATIVDMIYPVGAIYMSVSGVSPATLFGGTWQRIQDTFLLAAGDSYAAGSTGGEATHTLTENEMPSHNHAGKRMSGVFGLSDGTNDGSTAGFIVPWGLVSSRNDYNIAVAWQGGGAAHNNMPPYLAVYVWKRTA